MKVLNLFIIAIALLLSGCVTGNVIDTQDDSLRIGLLLPLSGPAAGLGDVLLETQMWKLQELQDQGVHIEFVVEDSQSNPAAAITGFQVLLQKNVDVVIAPTSGVGLALKPLAEEHDVLLWSIASHPDMTINTSYVVRHSNFGKSDAELLLSNISAQNIGVLYQQDDWGISLKKDIDKLGAIAKSEMIDQTKKEFKSTLTKVLDMDAIIIIAIGPASITIIGELKELGFEGKIYSSVGLILTPGVSDFSNTTLSGTYYQTYDINPIFEEEYEQKFGKKPSPFGYVGYSDIELIWNANQATNSKDAKTLVAYFKNQSSIQLTYELAQIDGQDIPLPSVMKVWE
jgi:branched-chain amino acid transport system substrate-binding protein